MGTNAPMRRLVRSTVPVLVAVLAAVAVAPAAAAGPAAPRAATGGLPSLSDIGLALVRQVCDAVWLGEACAATAYTDPGYRTDSEPSPGRPLELRVGTVHEHSGYSDGDPTTRPSDYFRAGRTGVNGEGNGVAVDFVLSSEHSDNEKLPVTTAAVCLDLGRIPEGLATLSLTAIVPPLLCSNVHRPDHYRKWEETLRQARTATEVDAAGTHTGFTALRGFEWTNDYYNHLGVYFSRNVVNAKIDLSYLSMDFFWRWLQEPAGKGGGDDALVIFNHPGGWPALTPFDGGLPHNQLLNDLVGGANWNDIAYEPRVHDRVVGIEIRGGDDLGWYVKGLRKGWHLGPVAAEDEHERGWSGVDDGKTLVLARGRSPQDYYHAFSQRRTVAVLPDLIGGAPGTRVSHPTVHYWADDSDLNAPGAVPMGATLDGGAHTLMVELAGLPAGYQAVMVTDAQPEPIPLGTAGDGGTIAAGVPVHAPEAGQDWWFVVACAPGVDDCGTGERYSLVTAPIWVRAG